MHDTIRTEENKLWGSDHSRTATCMYVERASERRIFAVPCMLKYQPEVRALQRETERSGTDGNWQLLHDTRVSRLEERLVQEQSCIKTDQPNALPRW
jgi:hypothetical protein